MEEVAQGDGCPGEGELKMEGAKYRTWTDPKGHVHVAILYQVGGARTACGLSVARDVIVEHDEPQDLTCQACDREVYAP